MNNNPVQNISQSRLSKRKRSFKFSIEKRHKFVIGTVFLSLGLFFAEFQFGKTGIYIPFIISILTVFFLYWAIYPDLRENRTLEAFILPFFYSLSFGMFYFLTPTAFVFRLLIAAIFAFGLYSVFLSQNILAISSIRTITLLSGARIVSFVATLLSYFFLTNIVFTLHLNIFVVIILMMIYSSALVFHSLWTYTLTNPDRSLLAW